MSAVARDRTLIRYEVPMQAQNYPVMPALNIYPPYEPRYIQQQPAFPQTFPHQASRLYALRSAAQPTSYMNYHTISPPPSIVQPASKSKELTKEESRHLCSIKVMEPELTDYSKVRAK